MVPHRDTISFSCNQQPLLGGPLAHGFDHYFGDDVPNFPPYTFMENDRVTAVPTEEKPDSLFGKPGKMAPGWKLEQVMTEITRKAAAYIRESVTQADTPFFLYFALTAPHTPIVPTADFRGKSTAGLYGDFVLEVDWAVGQLIDALEQTRQRENTLIIFTSDNGSPARDGTHQSGEIGSVITQYGHHPNGKLRGLKADIWEGGHRVPLIMSWPGHLPTGEVQNTPVSSIDLYRTIADLLGQPFPGDEQAKQDSYSLWSVLKGQQDDALGQRGLIHHSGAGVFAIRKGPWKLILSDVSGGFSDNLHPQGYGIETEGQLYHLEEDPAEQRNLYNVRPNIVKELSSLLEQKQK